MPVYVCMLRGVNVGGHGKIKMDALRALCGDIQLHGAQTYVQSGNVVFRSREANETKLAAKIQDAIEKEFGFAPPVMLRTTAEMRAVVKTNPFAKRKDVEPGKLLVDFLRELPGAELKAKIAALKPSPEELHLVGRELYIYFPDGQGRSKFVPGLDRVLKDTVTGRNWNSVTKLLEMAEALENAEFSK
ncbi:MAG TPA: DUF1697 domain-containing protein [Candidatus Koribacter sp.]|jgi:uncharacterized protein (DUF1697 family)